MGDTIIVGRGKYDFKKKNLTDPQEQPPEKNEKPETEAAQAILERNKL